MFSCLCFSVCASFGPILLGLTIITNMLDFATYLSEWLVF
ncbi:hypothetical protein BAP_59 [Bacillus sp. CN2]|nr:hypothetical protein BAP_59 [Bacillus sp. CN2]